MIPLLPYWKFVIQTPLSQQEAMERLSSAVAPIIKRSFSLSRDTRTQPFTGTISGNEFQIERIIQYRNSFLPSVYGRFVPDQEGLRIRIVMVLSPIILIIAIGLSLNILAFLVSFIYQVSVTGSIDDGFKKPALIIAFLYVVCMGSFAYEAVIARRLLTRLFLSS